MLREGEEIEAADLIVSDCYYEHPSETSIGQKVKPSETILRFTVEKK